MHDYYLIDEFPQALFQCSILILSGGANDAKAGLIGLSILISLTSLFLQILQLNTLAKKESYSSVNIAWWVLKSFYLLVKKMEYLNFLKPWIYKKNDLKPWIISKLKLFQNF